MVKPRMRRRKKRPLTMDEYQRQLQNGRSVRSGTRVRAVVPSQVFGYQVVRTYRVKGTGPGRHLELESEEQRRKRKKRGKISYL